MMKKLFHAAVWALPMAALLFVGSCSDSDNENNAPVIELTGGTTAQQTVYADDKDAPAPIRFTAPAPWTATVAELQTKAEAGRVDWLELSAYSGNAGDVSLTMTLKVNTTGQDRKAEIRIECGGTTLTITVEQKGTKQDGTQPEPEPEPEPTPEDPNKPDASNLKYRITKIEYEERDGGHITIGASTFAYDDAGRLIKQEMVRKWAESTSALGTSVYTTTVTYGEGTVSYKYTDYDDGVLDIQGESTAVLDENGRIVSGESVFFELTPEGMEEDGFTKYTLAYDKEGYLVQSSVKEGNTVHPVDEVSPDVYHTIWTDGNPTRVEWEYDYDRTKKNIEYATYGTVPNNTNLDLNRLLLLDTEGWAFSVGDERGIFAAMGYTGKRSKNLADNIRWEHAWNDGNSVRMVNYTYEFDEEGRVVGITGTHSDETAKFTIHYAK